MLYQFMSSHSLKVRRRGDTVRSCEKLDHRAEHGTVFLIRDDNDKYQVAVQTDEFGQLAYVCNCKYAWGTGLYCSHVFAMLSFAQQNTIAKVKPTERWLRTY